MTQSTRLAVALAVLLALAGATPVSVASTDATPVSAASTDVTPATADRTQGETPVVVGPAAAQGGPGNESARTDESAGADEETDAEGNADTEENPGADARQANDSDGHVVTEGFDPSYDPDAVLRRVERLRGISATGTIVVHEYPEGEGGSVDVRDRFGAIRPPGAVALQLYSNATAERQRPLGYATQREGATHVFLMNATDLKDTGVPQEVVLAHELVHALQFQSDLVTVSREFLRSHFSRWTTDAQLVTTALVEGDAMWVTRQYVTRYAESNFTVGDYNRSLSRAEWPHSVSGTPYYYGYQYYRRTGSSPDARSEAIRTPPRSTAQLLHPAGFAERAPLPDAPNVSTSDEFSRYHTDTVGELVVRHALRINGQSFARAAEIADGWANDRMSYYAVGGSEGTAVQWTTVWENETEAREFAAGWRDVLESNGARTVGDALVVPATDHAPEVYYVIERTGSVVRVTTAPSAETAERLASEA